jgi:hypothetical protein
VHAETGPALVGTHQDLLGGYEAGSLLIADSERMADRGPSLIAPADSARLQFALKARVAARRSSGSARCPAPVGRAEVRPEGRDADPVCPLACPANLAADPGGCRRLLGR